MNGESQQSVSSKLDELLAEREVVAAQLADLDERIAACRLVREMLTPKPKQTKPRRRRSDKMPVHVTADELRGMALHDAMVLFAQRHGGIFNTYLARPLLIESGAVIGESATVSATIHSTLDQSEEFEPFGKRGSWRYMPVNQPSHTQTEFPRMVA